MPDWIDNGYLYHYTNVHAVLGIVRSRRIWATQIDFLNDGRDGLVVSDLLQQMTQHPHVYLGDARQFPKRHLEALQSHLGAGRLTFVASFSRVPNVLTQFRMYCPSSGGFVIGFPRDFLAKAGKLVEVNYNGDDYRSWCHGFFMQYMDEAAKLDEPNLSPQQLAYKMDCQMNWRNARIEASPTFKNAEFSFEQEFRLVHHGPATHVRAPASGSLLIPYVELELPNEPVQVHIAGGPSRYSETLVRRSEAGFHLAAQQAGTQWQMCQLGIGAFGFRELT